MPRTCCQDFTRAEALRHSVAQAGRGLRAIEPGMPVPAGTGMTRRSLLLRGAIGGLSVYGASRLGAGAFEAGIAEAAETPGGRVLVSVFLPGGLDSMAVLAPTGDPRYAALRPTLKLARGAGTAFQGDPRLEWSDDAAALRVLHEAGKLAVAPAIGYDGSDLSHFASRHFYEVGQIDATARYGWLGRFLDRHGVADNPLQGLSLDHELCPSLAAADVPVSAVYDPSQFGVWAPGMDGPLAETLFGAVAKLATLPTSDPARLGARRVAGQIDALRQSFGPFQQQDGKPAHTSPVSYADNDFASRLSTLAAMLDADLPLRVVTIDAPGDFDTHAEQARTLGANVRLVCESLSTFQRDLEARGLADRVVTMIWSEFGRRPKQNADGTDHGAAGAGFLMGSRVRGGLIGEFPGLATLDAHDNLRATADFRSVYSSLLEQWFGVDAAPIIPGAAGFARPRLIATAS